MKLKVMWVGKNKNIGKEKEKEYILKYGDALLTSGLIKDKGKKYFGYSVTVPEKLLNKKVKISNKYPWEQLQ